MPGSVSGAGGEPPPPAATPPPPPLAPPPLPPRPIRAPLSHTWHPGLPPSPRPSSRGGASWLGELRDFFRCEAPELFRDEPFTKDDWRVHNSWQRHVCEPAVFMRVFRSLAWLEIWVLLVTVCTGLYYELLQEPHGWPKLASAEYMPIFTLISFAVALVLVFRTNSSYDRWWEARRACGGMYNYIRNFQRLAISWVPPEEEQLLLGLSRWNASLTAAAAAYIRGDPCFYELCSDVLLPGEIAWLRGVDNPPIMAMQVMSRLLKRCTLTPWERASMEEQLSHFDIVVGVCERISRQPIPQAWSRHTSRLVVCYLSFLPLAIFPIFKWGSILAMAVTTFLLAGVENIGVQLEEPYGALPLHRFSIGCKNSVLGMMRERHTAARMADAAEALARQQLGQGLKQVEPVACAEQPQVMRRDYSSTLLAVTGQ